MPYNKNHNLVKNEILGVKVTNASANRVLEYVLSSVASQNEPYYIVTPNPEIIVRSQRDQKFRDILNAAEVSLCDGIGLYLAGAILGKPLKERITGVGFMQEICKYAATRNIQIGLLGGQSNVAKEASKRLQRSYPGLKIGFVGEEWDDKYKVSSIKYKGNDEKISNFKFQISNKKKEKDKLQYAISHMPIDILFVAFGAPKQEIWMSEHIGKIPVKIMMGVGGAFDEISGKVDRCPLWIDMLGFKWLWRLVHEPWRWRRQLALITFVRLVWKEKFKSGIKNKE